MRRAERLPPASTRRRRPTSRLDDLYLQHNRFAGEIKARGQIFSGFRRAPRKTGLLRRVFRAFARVLTPCTWMPRSAWPASTCPCRGNSSPRPDGSGLTRSKRRPVSLILACLRPFQRAGGPAARGPSCTHPTICPARGITTRENGASCRPPPVRGTLWPPYPRTFNGRLVVCQLVNVGWVALASRQCSPGSTGKTPVPPTRKRSTNH